MNYKLFWRIEPEARAKLMQYQFEHYGTRLDIESEMPPWEEKPPVPEIPVDTEMDEAELREFMSQPPSGQEKVI